MDVTCTHCMPAAGEPLDELFLGFTEQVVWV
jgi:hypothetical protein